jgi:hypothetical protein
VLRRDDGRASHRPRLRLRLDVVTRLLIDEYDCEAMWSISVRRTSRRSRGSSARQEAIRRRCRPNLAILTARTKCGAMKHMKSCW